jgi:hypothetical protein
MHLVWGQYLTKKFLLQHLGHNEVAQTVNHAVKHAGENDAIAQQFLLTLCPHGSHLFASSHWHADTGCSLEAIDTTRGYVMQQGSKERHTVGIGKS